MPDPRPGRAPGIAYRTGDLVRRRDDGNFLFLGRIDSAAASSGRADSRLIDDGLLDSRTLWHLVSFLEDSFGIVVASEEIVPENFETIPLIAALVERTLPGVTSVG